MSPQSQPRREPRSQVVFRYTLEVVRHSGLNLRKLANRIAEAYQEQVAPHERIVEFHTGTTLDQLEKAERLNAQLIDRIMKGVVKMPADLEEAWVSALPDPWRTECERELARRYGFLAARAPAGEGAATATLCSLMREFGETVEAIAPILADGRIDHRDQPHLRKALKESTDLQAELVALQKQLTDALPDPGQDAANVTSMRRG